MPAAPALQPAIRQLPESRSITRWAFLHQTSLIWSRFVGNYLMETLKSLADVTAADERNMYFRVSGPDAHAAQQSLEQVHSLIESIVLHEGVPEAIRDHFAQAQNLALYSWYYYPFNVTAQFMAFVSVELALKMRLGTKATFKQLIQKAIVDGLVTDTGFAITAHRKPTEGSYVETLAKVMPDLRNRLAHGTTMLHNKSLSSLRTCADFINQLF